MISAYIILVTGVWLVTWSLIMDTHNVKSAFIFKVIPFFLGLANIVVSGKILGWF